MSAAKQASADVSELPVSGDNALILIIALADFIYDDSHRHDDTHYSEMQVDLLGHIRNLAETLRRRRFHGEKGRSSG